MLTENIHCQVRRIECKQTTLYTRGERQFDSQGFKPAKVPLATSIEIDMEHNYYGDLGVEANVSHNAIQAAYDAACKCSAWFSGPYDEHCMITDGSPLGKHWSPFLPGGKRRWKREIYAKPGDHYYCQLQGEHHQHHQEDCGKKAAKSWVIVEKAGKVLLNLENRIKYDVMRAEMGYDLGIRLEWDIAGCLKQRNEDLGSYLEGGEDDAQDSDSVVVRWCGRTGK